MLNTPIAGTDYELNLPKGYLSNSQIEKYLNCPEQYRRAYVLGEEELYNENLAEGQAFHTVLRKTNDRYLRTGRHSTSLQAIKQLREAIAIENNKLPEPLTKQGMKPWLERGIGFIKAAWGKKDQPIWRPCKMEDGKPGVEWEWKMELAGVPLTGFCDLVEETNCTDFKVASSARDWNKKLKYDPVQSLQANLYRIAANRLRFGFEVFEKSTGKVQFLSHKVDDLEPIRQWVTFAVAHVAKAISLGVFPPTSPDKNGLCDERWCPFWKTCAGAGR